MKEIAILWEDLPDDIAYAVVKFRSGEIPNDIEESVKKMLSHESKHNVIDSLITQACYNVYKREDIDAESLKKIFALPDILKGIVFLYCNMKINSHVLSFADTYQLFEVFVHNSLHCFKTWPELLLQLRYIADAGDIVAFTRVILADLNAGYFTRNNIRLDRSYGAKEKVLFVLDTGERVSIY